MYRLRSPLLLVPSCAIIVTLITGCGNVGSDPDVKLGVPYHAQAPGSLDCGPVSVLMWAEHDGRTGLTQEEIGDWMGGTCSGVGQQAIADAVNNFTNTFDAYWDLVGSDQQDEFMSRQITSIDVGVPVIAIISFNHAGVVNGGKWHELSGGQYQWDYTYFHDPLDGPNRYYVADDWISANCPTGSPCEQIISAGASNSWSSNLGTYGDDVVVGGDCDPSCGPGGDPLPK